MAEKVRVDKWLWSVRIFKSRSMATEACRSGKVRIKESTVKASTLIRPGVHLKVRKNGFNLQFEVVKLISKRVSATLAQPCYKDLTPPEELNKYKDWYIGKASAEVRLKGEGRPTKRDRRQIDDFKDHYLEWTEEFED
ncbi:MAG: RNA-binding S4 domain-containing protein [Saprospiraceae bacterium]|nr:RNA-binding S4 domain-containing protein [Saprospiraceae bacterium]